MCTCWRNSIRVNQNLPDATSWSPSVLIYLPWPRGLAAINSTISTFCATACLSFSPSVMHTHTQSQICTPPSMWNQSSGRSVCSLALLSVHPASCLLIKAIDWCHTMRGWQSHWSGSTSREQQYGGEEWEEEHGSNVAMMKISSTLPCWIVVGQTDTINCF